MLQRIRDSLQSQKWVAYTVLGALALVFGAWGAYGIVDLNFGSGNYAAKVEDETISLDEAREAWMQQQTQWQQQTGMELPPEQQKLLQDQVLEAFVRNSLVVQRARDLGYRVSDAQLVAALRNEPAFQVDGKYSADVAKARLAQAGISLPRFEAEMRRSLQRDQIENGIRASDFLTRSELERIRGLENEEREVRYALLPAEKFAGSATVDDAAVKAYYDEHQAEFLTPESVRLQYADLRLDQLTAKEVVTAAEVREHYEQAKDQYVQPEKRRARHILIQAEGDDAAARKKAEEVLAEAKAGKDFAELARKYSADSGSAAQGGDLGWAERGNFVAPFSDALFGMAVDEIRGPVKSEFGYHIIRLDGVQPGKTRSFDEVRGEIEAQLRRERATDRLGDVHEQLQTRLEQPGASLEALAREFGMQTGEVKEFLRGSDGEPPLGSSPELQEAVFADSALGERRIVGPVVLGEDRLVLAKVLDHHKPAPRPVAEVRDQIVAAIRRERGTEAATKAAEEARKRLEGGASIEEVSRDLGVTAEPARFVGRGDPSLPAQIRDTAFDGPRPAGGKPVVRAVTLDSGGAALVTVSAVRSQAAQANPQLEAMLTQQTLMRHGMGDASAYVEELRRKADVKKNPQAFQ